LHIPALILGGGIAPKHSGYIASQTDLPTTLLGLAGISGPHPMPGVDLSTVEAGYIGRAVMQFSDHQAHLAGDDLTVLRPSRPPLAGHIGGGKFVVSDAAAATGRAQQALASALWPSIVYRSGEYQLGACPHADTRATCAPVGEL
jgi:hypothetical protein